MATSSITITSQEEIHPVPCSNPNIPPGTSTIPIPHLSLLDKMTDTSLYVFPAHLDLDRLRRSLATLCGIIPTLCARYKSSGEDYYFDLCGRAVPLTIAQSSAEDPIEDPEHRRQVNQHGGTYDLYLPSLRGKDIKPNSDSPLIAFQYTTFASGTSSLSLSMGHILGDIATHHYIIHTLSDIYEKDGTPDSLVYPRFDLGFNVARIDAFPRHEDIDPSLLGVTILRSGTREEVMEQYVAQGHAVPLEMVVVTLSANELSALKKRCETLSHGLSLSRMDVITGWTGSIPERLGGTRYKSISYIFNFRAVTDIPSTYSGNAVSSVEIDIDQLSPDGIERVALIARNVRQSINRIRSDPAYVKQWLELTAHEFHRLTRDGHVMSWAFHPDELYINSYASFDFSVTFGFPKDRVRTHAAARAHLRGPMMSMAPSAYADRGIEVGLMVEVAQAERLRQLIDQDRKTWMSGS